LIFALCLLVTNALNGKICPCGEAGPHFFLDWLDLVGGEQEAVLAFVAEFECKGALDVCGFVNPIGCVSGRLNCKLAFRFLQVHTILYIIGKYHLAW
jgi:hypothetical protein